MVVKPTMDEDDDLEALRLAALQTIRPRASKCLSSQDNSEKAKFFRPRDNPNLIAIVPLDSRSKSDSTKFSPSVSSLGVQRKLDTILPQNVYSTKNKEESNEVSSKFSRFKDSGPNSDEESWDDDESFTTTQFGKKRESNSAGGRKEEEGGENKGSRGKEGSYGGSSGEDGGRDPDGILSLSLDNNDDDDDSLEKLMDQMEEEFNRCQKGIVGGGRGSTKKRGNVADGVGSLKSSSGVGSDEENRNKETSPIGPENGKRRGAQKKLRSSSPLGASHSKKPSCFKMTEASSGEEGNLVNSLSSKSSLKRKLSNSPPPTKTVHSSRERKKKNQRLSRSPTLPTHHNLPTVDKRFSRSPPLVPRRQQQSPIQQRRGIPGGKRYTSKSPEDLRSWSASPRRRDSSSLTPPPPRWRNKPSSLGECESPPPQQQVIQRGGSRKKLRRRSSSTPSPSSSNSCLPGRHHHHHHKNSTASKVISPQRPRSPQSSTAGTLTSERPKGPKSSSETWKTTVTLELMHGRRRLDIKKKGIVPKLSKNGTAQSEETKKGKDEGKKKEGKKKTASISADPLPSSTESQQRNNEPVLLDPVLEARRKKFESNKVVEPIKKKIRLCTSTDLARENLSDKDKKINFMENSLCASGNKLPVELPFGKSLSDSSLKKPSNFYQSFGSQNHDKESKMKSSNEVMLNVSLNEFPVTGGSDVLLLEPDFSLGEGDDSKGPLLPSSQVTKVSSLDHPLLIPRNSNVGGNKNRGVKGGDNIRISATSKKLGRKIIALSDDRPIVQKRKISVNIKPTALLVLEEKSKKLSEHKLTMEKREVEKFSLEETLGKKFHDKQIKITARDASDIDGNGSISDRSSHVVRLDLKETAAASQASPIVSNNSNLDLRAELSRRRAERLKGGINPPSRLLQSAFEGLIGKKPARLSKVPSETSVLIKKTPLSGGGGGPLRRRVKVVRERASSPLKSGSQEHGHIQDNLRGDSSQKLNIQTGRSILHRNQV